MRQPWRGGVRGSPCWPHRPTPPIGFPAPSVVMPGNLIPGSWPRCKTTLSDASRRPSRCATACGRPTTREAAPLPRPLSPDVGLWRWAHGACEGRAAEAGLLGRGASGAGLDSLLPGLTARGLLFSGAGGGRRPLVIVCGDASSSPEQLAGLDPPGPRFPPGWLVDLVGRGATVYLPQSVERLMDHPYCQTTNGKDRRAILYRLAYVVGRTVPGLDVRTCGRPWIACRPIAASLLRGWRSPPGRR